MRWLVTLPLLLAVLGLAAGPLAWAQPEIVAKFVPRAHPYPGGTLPYRLFVPDSYAPDRLYPLVLTLHGAGQVGTDNLRQIQSYRLATSWADPANQARNPCFVASPQCPVESDWEVFAPVLVNLIDSLSRQYAIDSNRVYVTGLSMGGYGTWGLLARYPGRFAAAVPMSAGWQKGSVSAIGSTPIWNFHGALDASIAESRTMINALEEAGREVLYTHVHGADTRVMPDTLLAAHIRAHADLLYTEYQFGGHDIWTESYDHPLLHPWVFSHYRQVPGALRLSDPAGTSPLHGPVVITWTGGVPSSDSLELWFSPGAGKTWVPLARAVPDSGSFRWETGLLPDCGLGRLKGFLRNRNGLIYATDRTGFLAIDNAGNGTPTVRIERNGPISSPAPLEEDSLVLRFRAADPEGAPLTVTLGFSIDSGKTFLSADSMTVPSDTALRQVTIRLRPLPNSAAATLRLLASDGETFGEDRTIFFIKQTPRMAGPPVTPATGSEGGAVKVNIVDPAALTGHRYRVAFSASGALKQYAVRDLTTGTEVLTGAREMDGSTEGPPFDGLRLIVTDHPATAVDLPGTRWIQGASTHRFMPFLPDLRIDTASVRGYAGASDYQITMAAQVVDTSSTEILGLRPVPLRFRIFNRTEQRMIRAAFLDSDRNGALSNEDELYFLEPDSAGRTRLTWGMTYTAMPGSVPPAPGDQFLFKTLKPIRPGDAYEFTAVLTGAARQLLPDAFRLFQNYPNPFNPSTTIRFALSRAVHTTLTVYTVLGQKVATLLDGVAAPGSHEIAFHGSGLASGVYFYVLRAGERQEVRQMGLVR